MIKEDGYERKQRFSLVFFKEVSFTWKRLRWCVSLLIELSESDGGSMILQTLFNTPMYHIALWQWICFVISIAGADTVW